MTYTTTNLYQLLLHNAEDNDFVDSVMNSLKNNTEDLDKQNDFGWTVLMYAVRFGKTELTKKLLKAGADISLKNKDGQTVLNLAAKYKRTGIIAILDNHMKHTLPKTREKIAQDYNYCDINF